VEKKKEELEEKSISTQVAIHLSRREEEKPSTGGDDEKTREGETPVK